MATCKIDHSGRVPKKIADLPESQAGHWRHRCAACAYEAGLADGERRGAAKTRERIKADHPRLRLHHAH